MAIDDQIKNLTKQLFPTGRVWRINPNSIKEKFINGLLASEIRAYNDSVSILDSIIPDNPNFTVDDASAWEKRLGLPDGTGIDLADRIKAILVQLNWPGTNPAKGAPDYMQGVLRDAGFNVCVQENLFGSSAAFGFTLTDAADNSKAWTKVCFGNGVFVAISGTSSMTSTDGITWTLRSLPITAGAITFGNGLFVIVQTSSTNVATSPDGVTWTTRTGSSAHVWTNIAYGNGVYVVVANGGTICMTSPDGSTWTDRTIPSGGYFALAFGNGLFVASFQTSINNNVVTSPDGITWTTRYQPLLTSYYSVVFGNGLFVMVDAGSAGNIITSPDGITWSAGGLPATTTAWLALAYGDGMFVSAAVGTTQFVTSPDGMTWTASTSPAANNWYSMAFGNNTFVAVSTTGAKRVMYSTPGYYHKTYAEFAGSNYTRYKSTLQYGQQNYGILRTKGVIVANSIDPALDDAFNIGDGSDTVFIGGCPPGTFINIPKEQETAFRQLILKIKPVNITVLLLVNFV